MEVSRTKSLMGTATRNHVLREMENHFVPALSNCIKIVQLKKIHACIVKLSLSQSNFLVTKMLDVCDNCGDTDYAALLFQQLAAPNVFSYNAIIRAYSHNHQYRLAISMFKQMMRHPRKLAENPISPDRFTFPFLIKSCAGLLCHCLGQQIHAQLLFQLMTDRDAISWNSLIYGHARLGQMESAKALFDEMPCRTIVSWTTMITGYARVGCYSHALKFFRGMQMVGIEPDEISIVSALPACAHLGALEVGKWIHMYSDKNEFSKKTSICNALIEMYNKCGCVDQARNLFDQLVERDVISWSTMIGGLANNGKAHEALELFRDMEKAQVVPNAITFLGVLTACTHAGLWKEGLKCFDSMREDYRIEPEVEHYGCLIDLLGRSGRLAQALDTIMKMPVKPDSRIWNSLLSSCRIHHNLDIAIIAMEHLLELEPDESGSYVLLANMYAELGKWEDVSSIRKFIRSKRIKKTPGCSLIEVGNVVEEFVSGDDSKPFSKEIFWILDVLALQQNRSNDVMEYELEHTDGALRSAVSFSFNGVSSSRSIKSMRSNHKIESQCMISEGTS
ncbi:pentatricopeptide repeat-containing protein At2g20540 isoform X2 [Prosopis cineraria]|uniref:pentatricopeptide repeat-containing protein At2g20540 isoform X2 n=1 Tax=Prosopis cineraria TaxID=364024 RepID=UPI00240FB4BF|nr:pentatricopeptide repeat-containing protein At2g20540 isoform X2 [Prosopis cineraria]